MFSIDEFDIDLSEYHLVIIGASVRYGKHNNKIIRFIKDNKIELEAISTAFFSVNLVARKEEKSSPDTNPYFQKFLKFTNWEADLIEVFAGRLDYASYGFLDKWMIKLIMKLTKGPTTSDKPIEYTNWNKVDSFGNKIVKLFFSN